MPTPFGFFGTLSGSIFFKMIMLLALCPVMERLFHAFPLDRVAFRRKPFPNADYALLPPALRERIYLENVRHTPCYTSFLQRIQAKAR